MTYPGRGMALKSNREMAQLCQNAIADLIAGKIRSYSMAGRSFTRESISALRALEKDYRSAHKRETYGRSHYLDMG